MMVRKKHATVATVIIFVFLALLIVAFFMREEEEPQIVTTPVLTTNDTEPEVYVVGNTNKERQLQARAKLLEKFKEAEIGG